MECMSVCVFYVAIIKRGKEGERERERERERKETERRKEGTFFGK